jgi:predicted ribosome quality control (RQC) complex YloA/Tae2 family protein
MFSKNFNTSVQCQKVWSTAHYIVLRVRLSGRNAFVYLGRGRGHEGFFPDLENPSPEMRISDSFHLFLKKYLEGQFIRFSVDQQDRILLIEGVYSSVYIFYKARDVHFIIHEKEKGIFTSWDKKWSKIENEVPLFEKFHFLGRQEVDKGQIIQSKDSVFKNEYDFTQKILNSQSKKSIGFELKKKKNINADILLLKKTLERKPEIIDFDNLNNLSDLNNFNYLKLRIKFNSDDSLHKRREKVLNKFKDIERALKIQEKRALERGEQEKQKISQSLKDFRFFNPMLEVNNKKIISNENASVSNNVNENYKTYIFDEFKLAVGLSAQGNDLLRKQWASENDYWVHLDQANSAHIVIKINDLNNLNNALKECAKIYANNKNLIEVNLIYCLVKNVKSMKGAAGLVSFKKEKRVKIYV